MKRLLFTLGLIIGGFVAIAQDNVLVVGVVYDKENNNSPMDMAAVQINGTQLGGLSEANGYFEIPVPKVNLKDSIKVSYIGYLPQTVDLLNYKKGDTLRVYMASSAVAKEEVVVVAENARGVILKAITNMKKNLMLDSLISAGLYRQYHKENGKYVRLIEADVQVAFNCKNIYQYSFHESVAVGKQRRSENYETNGDEHGDHLVDLLKENPFSYNRNNFLNPKMIDFYAPKFASENQEEYVISLQYKESSSAKLEKAKVWVEKETYAITKVEIEKFPNPFYVKSRYANDTRWQLVNERNVIETEKVNGKFAVSSITRSYNHHVLNKTTGNVDYIVEESFEIYFDKYQTDKVGAELGKGKFSAFTELYATKYKYDDVFWKNYELQNEYPLAKDIIKDLEHTKPLHEQFKDAGK